MSLWIIWLIIAGFLLVMEMITLTFYLLWIGIGACAGALIAFFVPGSLILQVFVACIVALLLTIFTKPLLKRMKKGKGFTDVSHRLVGKTGVIVKKITEEGIGIVKVGSDMWSASSNEGIEIGTEVVIKRYEGTILYVEKRG